MPDLTPRDRVILVFEDTHSWENEDQKQNDIYATFGIRPARYYSMLEAVINNPAALAENPMLVKRLQRRRDKAYEARAARRFDTA